MNATSYSDLGLIAPRNRIASPHYPRDVASILDQPLLQCPDKTALIDRHGRLTYRQLDAAVCTAADALRSLGIAAGDRVAASMGNQAEIVIAFLACQRLGAIWLGINAGYAAREKAHMLRDSGARLLIASPKIVEQIAPERPGLPDLERVLLIDVDDHAVSEWHALVAGFAGAPRRDAPIDPWAPAAIGYTSGTTGYPKGVVHSQHNMAVAAAARRTKTGGITTRHGVATPLTIVNLMIVGPVFLFAKGGTLCCIERLYAPEIAEWIKRERLESISSAPAVLYDMATNPDISSQDVASLKSIGLGGAHVPEAMRDLYREFFGDKMTYGYGLTEAPTGVATTEAGRPAAEGSVGHPMPHIAVRIVDGAGDVLGPGEVGEITLGPVDEGEWAGVYTPMLGYWKNPGASAAALNGGWLHTGDLGILDDEGALHIKGRLKDMIIRGGANIYPAEIERVLQDDQAVLYSAVAGKPDPRLGEVVVAFVQLRDAALPAEEIKERLIANCERNLSKFKVPSEWVFVGAMPRNDMNKIVKSKLIETYFPG